MFDYIVAPEERVRWQEDEVEWGSYISLEEVRAKAAARYDGHECWCPIRDTHDFIVNVVMLPGMNSVPLQSVFS